MAKILLTSLPSQVAEMVSGELKLFELNSGKKARVVMAVRRLRQYLFQVYFMSSIRINHAKPEICIYPLKILILKYGF